MFFGFLLMVSVLLLQVSLNEVNSDESRASSSESGGMAGLSGAWLLAAAAVALLALCAGLLAAFVSAARRKRSLHGKYNPQKQEFSAPRLELEMKIKPPAEERLI